MRRAWVLGLLIAVPAVPAARADVLGPVFPLLGDGAGSAGGSATGSGNANAMGSPASAPPTDDLDQWAGAAQPTTLPELLQSAIAHAPALASAQLDIAIADAQVRETWERYDWALRAVASASHTGAEVAGSFVLSSSTTASLTADITRTFSTGGTIDIHAGTQYSDYGVAFLGMDSKEWQDTITASFTQPLLKGYGRALYDAQEQRAIVQHDIAALQKRLVAIQAVQTVVSAYWDLVLAERQVAITQASLDLAHERLRVTQLQADAGKTAKSEIPAVLQIIATREEDVLNGELAVLNASIALRRAAGMPIGAGALALRVAVDVDIRESDWNVGALSEKAFAASPQLAQLAKQGAQNTIDVEVTRNGLLPQLDAALSLGPTGTDTSFVDAGKNLVELKSIAINGSLTFSRSLHQYDVKGRLDELAAGRDKLAVSAIDVKAEIAQAMATAVAQVELAQRRVKLSQRAIELANDNIRIETDRFNLGRSTNFDVLNRLEDLRQAELRKTQAMIDWHKAEGSVDALTTELLTKYGIQLK
jgi:outer membrane protein TolC